jgi:hypothetical protein
VVISGPYSNLSLVERIKKFAPEKEDPKERVLPVSGDGLIVMHGTRLDVDISIRISDLLRTIESLTDRVILLESMLGAGPEESTPTPATEFRIGIWRFFPEGEKLLKQVDLNKGLTIIPNWCTKSEDSLNGDET